MSLSTNTCSARTASEAMSARAAEKEISFAELVPAQEAPRGGAE
jgi:hypothetical protein